jgi:hypothetical protein
MTATTGNEDYNAGQALHCGRSDDGRGRQQSKKSAAGVAKIADVAAVGAEVALAAAAAAAAVAEAEAQRWWWQQQE